MSKMCSVFNIFSSPEAGGGVDKYLVLSSASSEIVQWVQFWLETSIIQYFMMNETLCLLTTLHFENASIIIIVPNYFRYLCKTFAIIKWCAQLRGS